MFRAFVSFFFATIVVASSQVVTLTLPNELKQKTTYPIPVPPAETPEQVPLPKVGDKQMLTLSFSDDFSGKEIDLKKWTIRGDEKRANGFWMRKNARLDGKGFLRLTTTRDYHEKGTRYSGAALESRKSFQQKFGYFECRAKLQETSGEGYHCSFWLQTDTTGDITDAGRNGTEIDLIEKFKKHGMIQHALHWDGYGPEHAHCNFTFPWPKINEGFHIYGLLWTPTEYTFFIDGVETWRTKAGGVSQVPAFLRLSTEFSEKWNGEIAKAQNLPDSFIVDYVRVFALQSQ